jgi:hypothetical protein
MEGFQQKKKKLSESSQIGWTKGVNSAQKVRILHEKVNREYSEMSNFLPHFAGAFIISTVELAVTSVTQRS